MTAYPDGPAWLGVQPGDNRTLVVSGTVPDNFASTTVQIALVNPAYVVIPLLLSVAGRPALDSTVTALRIRNMNTSVLLASPAGFETFLHIVPLLAARLGLANGALAVSAVADGEPTPRNLPPTAFSPPLAPPNAWFNRTAAISIVGVAGVASPSCAQVTAAVGTTLAQAGFDVMSCTAVARPQLATQTYASLQPSTASGAGTAANAAFWSRSRSDFNETLVPAIVVACVLLGVGLLVALCLCVCRRRSEHRRVQSEALAENRVNRTRLHTMREGGASRPGARLRTAPSTAVVDSADVVLDTPGPRGSLRPAHVADDAPRSHTHEPPPYRAPPMHKF